MDNLFGAAKDVWWSPLGGGIVTLLLSYPAHCTGGILERSCTNVLGFAALTPNEGTSTVAAFGVGLVCWAVAALIKGSTNPNQP